MQTWITASDANFHRDTQTEGATETTEEGAEGHDTITQFVAEGIRNLPGDKGHVLVNQGFEVAMTL